MSTMDKLLNQCREPAGWPPNFAYFPGAGTATTNGVTPFDHTSVIRTIVECFGISGGNDQPAYLTQRDLNAPSLAAALSLGPTNMNNGPSSVVLPPDFSIIVQPSGDNHLAAFYGAMVSRQREAENRESAV